MKASTKKQIERSIRELVQVGDQIPVLHRESRKNAGTLTVSYVSREEIHGTIAQENSRWQGVPAKFRVPQLTQKGGENLLDLSAVPA